MEKEKNIQKIIYMKVNFYKIKKMEKVKKKQMNIYI